MCVVRGARWVVGNLASVYHRPSTWLGPMALIDVSFEMRTRDLDDARLPGTGDSAATATVCGG